MTAEHHPGIAAGASRNTRPVVPRWIPALTGWLLTQLHAERDRWPLWLPVGLGVGIAVYFGLHFEPPVWLGGTGLAACVMFGIWARGRPILLIAALVIGALLAGFTAAQLRTALVAAPVLEKRLGPVNVIGQVLRMEPRSANGRIVLHRLEIAGLATEHTPAKVRIRLTLREPAAPRPGAWLQVRAVLRPPPAPAAPGAFDFARQAYFKRLGGVGYAVGHVELLEAFESNSATSAESWRSAWHLWWSGLRNGVTRRVLGALPDLRGAVATALMTGERGAIPEPVIDAMRDSGLAHLLAISGLHMGLVAGLLFFGVRALLALVPRVALNYPIKKWAAVAAGLGAFAYLFLSGATVPTQRAFIMILLVLLAVLLDRRAISLRLVAWAAVAVLLLAPESLLSASFQMSFAAVTALVAGYEILARHGGYLGAERGLASRVAIYLAGVALTSVIAILATTPFALFHFNRIALYGLAANLAAVPLTAFWIMPWAVVAFLLMPFGLEALALIPMGWGIDALVSVAAFIAALPGAATAVKAMPLAGLCLVVLGGLWLCLWFRPWRCLGTIPIAAGLACLLFSTPPDVLVGGDGKLLAVRAPDGAIWLSSQRRGRFTAETWLRRAGAVESHAWPLASDIKDSPLRCDQIGCIYRAGGQVVALALDGRALAEDCGAATIVISLEPLRRRRCPAPKLVIDRFDLWRNGSHALWLKPDNIAVESVAMQRGARPWVRQRRDQKAQ